MTCLITTGVQTLRPGSQSLLLPRLLLSTVPTAWTSNPPAPNPLQLRSFVAKMSLYLKSTPIHIHCLHNWNQFRKFHIDLCDFCLGPPCVCVLAQLLQSCLTLCNPMDCIPQAPLSVEFSRHTYWSGLPCPPPGELPDPGIEPKSPVVQVDSLPTEPPRKPRAPIPTFRAFSSVQSLSRFSHV